MQEMAGVLSSSTSVCMCKIDRVLAPHLYIDLCVYVCVHECMDVHVCECVCEWIPPMTAPAAPCLSVTPGLRGRGHECFSFFPLTLKAAQ